MVRKESVGYVGGGGGGGEEDEVGWDGMRTQLD